MDYSFLGKRIRAKRKQLQLTQAQLADMIGFSSTYVGHLERGNRSPSIETFILLARALNVKPNYLLQDYIDLDSADNGLTSISRDDYDSLLKVASFLKDYGVEYEP